MIKGHNSLQGRHTYNKVNIPFLHEKFAKTMSLKKWRQKFQGKVYALYTVFIDAHKFKRIVKKFFPMIK